MKKMVTVLLLVSVTSVANAEIFLPNDSARRQIPAFIPVPSRSLAPITGTYVFKMGVGGNTDITGWSMILVRPSADVTYYYNNDTTKVKTLMSDKDNLIFVGQAGVDKITITLGANTAEIQGR